MQPRSRFLKEKKILGRFLYSGDAVGPQHTNFKNKARHTYLHGTASSKLTIKTLN